MKSILSNETLRTAVEKELQSDPEVDSRHISITAVDGAITLRGQVVTDHQKHAAVRAAERVEAVVVVADEIEVGPASHVEIEAKPRGDRSDEEIAEEIASLRGRDQESYDSVGVQVRDGRVILHGYVTSTSDREFIEGRARSLTGVRALANLIEVASPPEPAAVDVDVEQRVKEAIAEVNDVDAGSIRVTMEDGTAQLQGRLSSVEALQAVLHAAETTPGVTAVESEIVVTTHERVS